ncbi:MAG TPA: type II toxin-antitoxin system VapC family toxin, partial [Candidatus Bathyarchaeia archaeon]
MLFIDANIWCYYFDARHPEHEQVRRFMRRALLEDRLAVNTIIVMEVAHYLNRNLSREDARRGTDNLLTLESLRVHDFDREQLLRSLDVLNKYSRSHGLGGRDATIIATVKSMGIDGLVTHDKALAGVAKLESVNVVDPV